MFKTTEIVLPLQCYLKLSFFECIDGEISRWIDLYKGGKAWPFALFSINRLDTSSIVLSPHGMVQFSVLLGKAKPFTSPFRWPTRRRRMARCRLRPPIF